MGPSRRASGQGVLLHPAALRHRLGILTGTFLDHQFERRSPIPPLEPEVLDRIQAREVVMPPRSRLQAPGTQTIDGLFFLASLATYLGVRRVFEIGTFTGVTTWTLARNLPGTEIHTLDLPPGSPSALPLERSDLENRQHPRTTRIFEDLPYEATIDQHWGDSATFDFSAWEGRCDLVYVDGAHSRDYVEADTRTAFRLVAPSGAIVWDDYWRVTPGVAAVLEDLRDPSLRRVAGTRLVVRLPPGAASSLE